MEKKQYEGLKELESKINNYTATFKERNVWNIIQKKKGKGKPFHFKRALA